MRQGSSIDILGFGEPELDANAALSELDKGLRSVKVGDQCEAIVRFPVLFERYPFPILINSAFLKLADVFRTGSNFLRLWVLRVCQQSERHLDKILNVDEFIKKIFSVTHSNDPIARALCLRALGSLSGLIPERKAVHHSIRVALDSHDRVEVSAAIYAASCFAQKSKTFGTTMCTKISSMVQIQSTPLDLKLRLIPIFQHMHHVATASAVRKLCQELLLSYPSENFVTTVLHTLTRLAVATISDLSEQICFLLKHLSDFRPQVKLSVLQDLRLLGEKGGHLWEASHISGLINSLLWHYSDRMDVDGSSDFDTQIVYTALDVINSLTSSSAILNFVNSQDTPLWHLLETSTQSTDVRIVLKAVEIGTSVMLNIKRTDDLVSTAGTRLVGLIKIGTESLLAILCTHTATSVDCKESEELQLKYLEKCLVHGALLSKSSPYFSQWFCETMGYLLQREDLAGRRRIAICQSLGRIGECDPESVRSTIPYLMHILNRWNDAKLEEESSSVTVLLATILQAHQAFTLGSNVKELLNRVMSTSNLWVRYRVGRNCLRYGQPQVAVSAFEGMSSTVCSENFHFWLSALHSISLAETLLCTQETPLLQKRLTKSTNFYLQAVASLKAASSPTASLEFQTEFVRLRSEMLVAFRTFLISCGNLQFSPLPATAPIAGTSGSKDTLLASGRIVSQLLKSVREFYNLGNAYERLYQTAFDSDRDSLLNVRILQQVCLLVGRTIEKVVVPKEHSSASTGHGAQSFGTDFVRNGSESSNCRLLIESCQRLVTLAKSAKEFPEKVITQQHVDCLKEAFRALIETPITYPRFFFQTLQNTRVKIAVSPQPRQPGENISVNIGNNLALKVEGVIDQSFCGIRKKENRVAASKYFRKPKAIRITVICTPVQNTRTHVHGPDLNKTNTEPLIVSEDVPPHRDFFTVQFLLGSWTSGVTNLSIETSIIDGDGRQWITGPKASLAVKVYDEVSKPQNQSSSSASLTSASRAPTSSPMQASGPSKAKAY